VDKVRAAVSFDASIMGIRHILFHYYFMEHVARPLGSSITEMSAKYALSLVPNLDLVPSRTAFSPSLACWWLADCSYERSFGRPTNKMVENMQQAFREIKKVKTQNDYFSRIGSSTRFERSARTLQCLTECLARCLGFAVCAQGCRSWATTSCSPGCASRSPTPSAGATTASKAPRVWRLAILCLWPHARATVVISRLITDLLARCAVPSAKELAEESIKSVVPLETLCVKVSVHTLALARATQRIHGTC
jgi:hypothetical protein